MTSTITFAESQQSIEDDSPSRASKLGASFMDRRRTFRVIEGGVDLTPDDVVDPCHATMVEAFSHAAFESRARRAEPAAVFKAASKSKESGVKVFATTINLDDIHIDHTLNTEEGFVPDETDLERAPSAFYLPKRYPVMSYPPRVVLVFKETETVFLYGLPSYSYDKGSEAGNVVEENNEFYQYITVGKGRNRKMVVEETQTEPVVSQSRHTLAVRPDKKNAAAFASMWDMHDTYARLARVRKVDEPDEMVLYQSAAPFLLRKKKRAVVEEKSGRSFEEIAATPEFCDAVMLTERVLAAKSHSDAQKTFRGLVRMDPLAPDLVYVYSMRPLWTLQGEDSAGRPVVGVSFNPKNEDVLAVAHGKFGYAESHSGLVCVWCTKNPCEPERIYRFPDPLTSVAFSARNPNWIACGFANGDVLILDVTSYPKRIIARSSRDTNPCFEPIWSIGWQTLEGGGEYVMTGCQDGRITRFTSTKTHDFIGTPMMRLSTVEGKMKGLQTTKTCAKSDVPVTRHPAALCLRAQPGAPALYLAGSAEGCVHRCSRHYLNQHVDVFRAHAGPVYALDFSPFMGSLLVSCGADGAVRLWVEGMDDVIMTLSCPAAVYDVAFCPVNATIILSVSGNVLSVWDLRRKTHIPCAEYTFPGPVILTYIKFSTDGANVFVGDSAGRVHTFHLEDTPIPPFYQRKMLDEAIRKALCTRPQLLKQLDKLTKMRSRN